MSTVDLKAGLRNGLSKKNFERIAELVQAHSGIKVTPNKRTMIDGRLQRRVRTLGFNTLDDYCDYLFENHGLDNELVYLLDVMTTNKTDFFREGHHFDFIARQALPEFVSNGIGVTEPLKAWSAPCSIGAEPYSLAMVFAEWERAPGPLRREIFAVDLSTQALDQAIKGIYPKAMMSSVPKFLQQRYFRPARDPRRGEVRICPEIRASVRFGHFNLMDKDYPPFGRLHLIFCRNTLIYFEPQVQLAVLTRLCRMLVPGGYLFLGHAETINNMALPIEPLGQTIYRRV